VVYRTASAPEKEPGKEKKEPQILTTEKIFATPRNGGEKATPTTGASTAGIIR
jgi:hypothetical protein